MNLKTDWFVYRDNEKWGPFLWSQICEMTQNGQIDSSDRLWHSQHPNYVIAGQVEGLFKTNSLPPASDMKDPLRSIGTSPASSFDGKVSITHPITNSQVRSLVDRWVKGQDDFWPPEITTEFLIKNLRCVYVANWILDATASGNWSASIGTERFQYEICGSCKGKRGIYLKDVWNEPYFSDCNTCKGKGQVKKSYIEWSSQSGVVNASLESKVIENISDKISLRCGKRNSKANETPLPQPSPQDIFVLQPNQTDANSGYKKAEILVHELIKRNARSSASKFGKVRDLQIAYVNIENVESRTWLYPIYIGSYDYEEATNVIQIDGITQKLFVEVPQSVKNKRIMRVAKIVGVIAAIALALFLIVLGINSLSALFNTNSVSQGLAATSIPTKTTTLAPSSPQGLYEGYGRVVRWSPDGRWIAVAFSSSNGITILHATDGQVAQKIKPNVTRGFRAIEWSPDGKYLAVLFEHHGVVIYETDNWQLVDDVYATNSNINDLAWSPDSQKVAIGDFGISVWDQNSGVLSDCFGYSRTINSLDWSPDGRFVAFGSVENNVRIVDMKDCTLYKEIEIGVTSTSIAWSPDGKRLAFGGDFRHLQNSKWVYEFNIYIWNKEDERIEYILEGHNYPVDDLVWTTDGKRIVSKNNDDGSIIVWNTETGQLVKKVVDGEYPFIHSVDLSPDGKWLAFGLSNVVKVDEFP